MANDGQDDSQSGAKRHVCPDCPKSFSRVDHLARHRLNHNPSQIYSCQHPGCTRTFVRTDLLVRHTERHERKAADGDTSSGALARGQAAIARKRHASAAAVAAAATTTPEPAASTATSSTSSTAAPTPLPPVDNSPAFPYPSLGAASLPLPSNGNAAVPNDQQQAFDQRLYGLPTGFTNPLSNPSPFNAFASSSGNSLTTPHDPFQQSPAASNSLHNFGNGMSLPSFQTTEPSPPMANNLASPHANGAHTSIASPQPHSLQPNPGLDHYFDPMPPPGPQSSLPGFEEPLAFIQQSYGAPFVSANEYEWLFDPTGGFDITFASSRPASPHQDPGSSGAEGISPEDVNARLDDLGFGQGSFGLPDWSNGHHDAQQQQKQEQQMLPPPLPQQQQQQQQPQQPQPIVVEQQPAKEPTPPPPPPPPAPAPKAKPKEKKQTKSPPKEPARELKNPDRPNPSPSPFSSNSTAVNTPYPTSHDPSVFVDDNTRIRIVDYLGHEWVGLRADPRMSRAAMTVYLENFWTRVHETQAPAVHRASFRADATPTPLLLAMMLLGCYFVSNESHQLAVKLHASFRGKVICSPDFRPRAEIWLHQTILLIVVFGKMCSTRMDHEMAHIFWSSCVTLGRRSAIFSARTIPASTTEQSLEAQWTAWIDEEVSKRVALIIFAVDVEHAALFRHSPTLSAFQIQLQLPCDEEEWEARTAQEWAQRRKSSRPPVAFISALKASLMPGHAPPILNPFSRIAILHGLLSVAQDLQWRDHVIGLSQPEGRANNWRDMISASYNSWKSRLDTCLSTATTPTTSQLLRASISLYAVAHITLSIDIHELQIYAGSENALGLVVSPAVYNATEARIRIWSSTKDARAACWHAAFFLRSSLQHYQQSASDLAGCLHHRWAVFIATLTLYCFGRATSGAPGPQKANYQKAAMDYLDSLCTAAPESLLMVTNKQDSLELVRVISEYVGESRWEIAREGAKILRKLLRSA